MRGFGKTASSVAPGPGASAGGQRAASFAQKLWRFCRNPRVKFEPLIEPLIQRVRDEGPGAGVLLAVHDWSTLSFGTHPSKTDRRQLTHASDVGYDLATVLMVRGTDGAPLAPVSVALSAAGVVHSTRPAPVPDVAHVDQVLGAMGFVSSLGLGAPVVHVIDREADSVGHWRAGAGAGHRVLVRADDRIVRHNGHERSLAAIGDELRASGELRDAGEARYRGRLTRRFVGQATVVLHRPARRWVGDHQRTIPGDPLELRLVVVEIRGPGDRVLARWLLLTNVPAADAGPECVADWYYWRWRIESLHKILKSGGWELEGWLQRTGDRVLRKLLVAFGALVDVWTLERRTDDAAVAFRHLLVSLSGRQTKRRQPVTTTALLAGVWVLQQAAGWLARDGPESPNALLTQHLPAFAMQKQTDT